MKVHEYQAKEILRKFGVAVPAGKVAFSVDEAVSAAYGIGGSVWVTHSVPPNSMITHREHERRERPADDLVEFHL